MAQRKKKQSPGRASPPIAVERALTTAMVVNPSKLDVPEGFSYTSTAVVQARNLAPRPPKQPSKEGLSPAEYRAAKDAYDQAKRDYAQAMQRGGCMQPRTIREVKSGRHKGSKVATFGKPTGERCKGKITWDEAGQPQCSTTPFRDTRCLPSVFGSGSAPCATARFAAKGLCPVQLSWVDGQPVMRLCSGQGSAGQLLRVSSPADAMKLAQKLCTEWTQNGRSWANVALPSDRDAGLGRARKKRTRKARS